MKRVALTIVAAVILSTTATTVGATTHDHTPTSVGTTPGHGCDTTAVISQVDGTWVVTEDDALGYHRVTGYGTYTEAATWVARVATEFDVCGYATPKR